MDITITISDDQYKVLACEISNPQEWLQAIVDSKVHFSLEKIITENTEYSPAKLTQERQLEITKGLSLKTKAEKDKEALALLVNSMG